MDPNSRTGMLGAAGAVGGEKNWFAYLGRSTSFDIVSYMTVDASGNSYILGSCHQNFASSNNRAGIIVKLDKQGALLWQTGFRCGTNVSLNVDLTSAAFDGSGNIYILGNIDNFSCFLKLNETTGALITSTSSFEYRVPSGSPIRSFGSHLIFKNGSLYFLGRFDSPGAGAIIEKMDLSFNTIWLKRSNAFFPQFVGLGGLAVDASENVYVSAFSSSNGLGVMKLNSSGNILFQKVYNSTFGLGGGQMSNNNITIDSSGNLCIVSAFPRAGDGRVESLLFKITPAGTLLFRTLIVSSGLASQGINVTTDPTNNIYVGTAVGGLTVRLVKFDSAGTVIFQRKFSPNAYGYISVVSETVYGTVQVFATPLSFYIAMAKEDGPFGGLTDIFIAKLPSDGTKTGSFGVTTYASVADTEDTPTIVQGTFSGSLTTLTRSTRSTTLSETGPLLSLSTTIIP